MLIDNTLRKRWDLTPTKRSSSIEEELVDETDMTNSVAPGLELGKRFRVSAQEWLLTWRTIE